MSQMPPPHPPQQPPYPQQPYQQQPYGQPGGYGQPQPAKPMKVRPSLLWMWLFIIGGLIAVGVGVVRLIEGVAPLVEMQAITIVPPGVQDIDLPAPGRYSIVPNSDRLPEDMAYQLVHVESGKVIELEHHDFSEVLGTDAGEDTPEWWEFETQEPGTLQFAAEAAEAGVFLSEPLEVRKGSHTRVMKQTLKAMAIAGIGFLVGLVGMIVVLVLRSGSRKRQMYAMYR